MKSNTNGQKLISDDCKLDPKYLERADPESLETVERKQLHINFQIYF